MDFRVDSWHPDYGSPFEDTLQPADAHVDVNAEIPAGRWRPLAPPPGTAEAGCVLFVDGVRRIDARVWITGTDGVARLGVCASYAAGVVRCDGQARLESVRVARGVFSPAASAPIVTRLATYEPRPVGDDDVDQLVNGIQQRLGELEVTVAREVDGGDLVVIDGPLSGRQNVPGAIGLVKTHRVAYLPAVVSDVVGELAAGERTPLFVTQTSWSRYSWYLRLPGGEGHPWAGVVRCEASADLPLASVVALADRSAATLVRYASEPHKEPRAPQNLYPIAGLEQALRRRLGDAQVLFRALRAAESGVWTAALPGPPDGS